MKATVALAFLTVALSVCGTGSQARPLDEVVASGTLRIAVYRDFPPFSYHREGKLVGVDVDLGHHIAERLGVGPSFIEITADENVDDDLRNAVSRGHFLTREVADLMLHVPIDRQLALRNGEVAFFAPYFTRQLVIAYDPEKVEGSANPHVFTDQKVGVELDSLPDFYLMSAYGGAIRESVVHFPTVEAAVGALREGQVAGVMAPHSQIEAGLGTDAHRYGFAPVAMVGFGRSSWVVGVAVKEDSRDLGYAVEDIVASAVANGEIARLFSAHGITYRSPDHR